MRPINARMATGHEINKKDFKVSSITTTAIENIIMHGLVGCGHAGRTVHPRKTW